MKYIFTLFFIFISTLVFSQTVVVGHVFAEVVEPVYSAPIQDTILIKNSTPLVTFTTDVFLKSPAVIKEKTAIKETNGIIINYN
jgi:hypothetical protein